MRLDLHLHSSASDGACTPRRVVEQALDARLDVIALTDHDTAGGVAEARSAARGHPIQVIPALEASSTWEGHDIHVLGYFVDPEAPALVAHEEWARERREARMREMLEKLDALGVPVSFDAVLRAAGEEVQSLARPHLAQALVDEGHVSELREAFDRFISDDAPAFVPTRVQSPARAVQMILEAGGVPVWAHPPRKQLDDLLPELVEAGLGGLEAYRPYHSPDYTKKLLRRARRHGLVVTGGSDWHGPDRSLDLGKFYVTADEVADFLEEAGM